MNTILIADSGSTKTDWMLLADGSCHSTVLMHTQGITPVHQPADAILSILHNELLPQMPVGGPLPRRIFFYGSGCTPAHVPMVRQLLEQVFCGAVAEVYSDLMGAARGLCGHEPGIACILGTGANSCLYDGERIVRNTPALGYILGDEGSGAVLGRHFFNAIFKNPDFAAVRDDYLSATGLTVDDVIRKVYREPMANRFLASASLYIGQHQHVAPLRQLVVDNFRLFFRHNLLPYGRPDLPVHVTGSMAACYAGQLAEAARGEGFLLGRTAKSPMAGLVDYHAC